MMALNVKSLGDQGFKMSQNNLDTLDQELYSQFFNVKFHPSLFKFKLPLMKDE